METVTISKEEYERLKKESEVDYELVEKIRRSIEEASQGKISEWKPKGSR